jgi:heat shock protein 4
MVGFDQSRKMGEQASANAGSNYKNTIFYMKRLIGLAFDDPRAQKEMKWVPFSCVPIEHKLGGPASIGVKVTLNGEDKILPMEAVCGMMIHHMGTIAAQKAATASGSENDHKMVQQLFPQDWVIAIPSYFDDAQRRALLSGCEMAGITGIQRLMHENTATALAYGIFKDIRKEFEKDKPTNVMFIDMGASAFSVSITTFEPGKLSVKSSYCDPDLGGRDFDKLIAEWLSSKFVEKFKSKLSGNPLDKPKVLLKLYAAAEKAKKTLSPVGVMEASINLECLMDDLDFHIKISSVEYEQMCVPLLERLAKPIAQALEEAKLTAKDLSSVELVGGCTRIGCIKRKMEEILGTTLSTTMNADESVARGAALQSAILSPRFKVLPYEIIEAQTLPVKIAWDEEVAGATQQGVEVDGDAEGADMPTNSVIMFGRGLNFPIVRRVTLRRNGTFVVTASYDDSARNYGLVEGATQDIATFTINAPAGEEKKIRVNVKEDIHGIINLSSAQMVEEIEEDEAPAPEGEKKEGEKKEGGEEAKVEEKKKKVKRTNLEYSTTQPLAWSKEEINQYNEAEVAMANNDRIVYETADMRNELESYIYDMRDKITSESQLAPYITEDEKGAFNAKQEEIENWLYEEGFDATKSVYAEKLAELKKVGGPCEFRAAEAFARSNVVSSIRKNIDKYKSLLADAQGNEKFAHITDDEFSKCHAKCDDTSSWVYGMLDKQGSLAANVNPAFTVADMNAKNVELTNFCSPIVNKPAPKKEKVPEPSKKEEKPAEAEQESEPMQTEEPPKESPSPEAMDVE